MNTRTNKTVLLIILMICLATAVYSAVGTFTFRTSGASDTTEVVDLRYPQKVPEDSSVTTDSIADGSITNDKLAEPISVANGGTGATTAGGARTNLGFLAMRTFVPVVTAETGTITTYTASGSYLVHDDMLYLMVIVTVADKGTAADAMIISLPAGTQLDNTYGQTSTAYEDGITGIAGITRPAGDGAIRVRTAAWGTPFTANGTVWHISGWFRLLALPN